MKDMDITWNTTRCIKIIDQPCANGWGSSGNRTKHIKERYCVVKDTVYRGDLKIEWCATE